MFYSHDQSGLANGCVCVCVCGGGGGGLCHTKYFRSYSVSLKTFVFMIVVSH